MTTIFESKEMVNLRREMLIRVIKDKQYAQKIVTRIEGQEKSIRASYHEALKEYDELTRPRRRFR